MNLLKRFLPPSTTPLHPLEYRQYMFLSIAAPIGNMILAFFTFYNWVVLERPIIAIVTALTLLATSFSYINFYRNKSSQTSTFIYLVAFICFLLLFNSLNENKGFGLVWTLLFPLVALVVVERKIGLVLSIALYILTMPILYSGLGIWLDGNWDITGLIRFTLGYFVIGYLIYVIELSNEKSYLHLKNIHKKQEQHAIQLRQMAITDSLTGLYNRRHLNAESEKLREAIQESNRSLIMVILDLDWFKNFNDSYGHRQGDYALIQVAQIINKKFQSIGGQAFRVGGEEFAGYVITDKVSHSIETIKSICLEVRNKNIEHKQSEYQKLTVSMGIYITQEFKHFDDVYKEADDALYQAKAKGRNCTIIQDGQSIRSI